MPTMPANYYNRFDAAKEYDKHLFVSGPPLQSAELNEVQDNLLDKIKGIGDAAMSDGHVVSGAGMSILAGTLTANAGEVYADGAVRSVPSRTFTVPTTGTVHVGVRVYQTVVTSDDDAELVNPVNNENYQVPGAARLKSHATWGYSTDGNPGTFYTVRDVVDGVLQALPSSSKLDAHIADADAHTQYAKLASPDFTGNPTAPTQTSGNNTTRLATTAFVQAALGLLVDRIEFAGTNGQLMELDLGPLFGGLQVRIYEADVNIATINVWAYTDVVFNTPFDTEFIGVWAMPQVSAAAGSVPPTQSGIDQINASFNGVTGCRIYAQDSAETLTEKIRVICIGR